ncbi:hypothetical protein, partial [Sinorhizobium meliloti]|uniref:hypothetical protein n=1 Tax=Rhizobium meliloti TaxID=382 RepID=UPI001AECD9BF
QGTHQNPVTGAAGAAIAASLSRGYRPPNPQKPGWCWIAAHCSRFERTSPFIASRQASGSGAPKLHPGALASYSHTFFGKAHGQDYIAARRSDAKVRQPGPGGAAAFTLLI